jgi:hypothetical protein
MWKDYMKINKSFSFVTESDEHISVSDEQGLEGYLVILFRGEELLSFSAGDAKKLAYCLKQFEDKDGND